MQFRKVEKAEIKSTAHSRYPCQYHIVFAPKYRRKKSGVLFCSFLQPQGVRDGGHLFQGDVDEIIQRKPRVDDGGHIFPVGAGGKASL